MDYSGSLAASPFERDRVFDAIESRVLQVNHLWCACREENSQKHRRGCGMWGISKKHAHLEDAPLSLRCYSYLCDIKTASLRRGREARPIEERGTL